jgi:two-component system chemotaxis sensor kinase CheA
MSDDLQFDSDEMAELRAVFFEQATEVLENLGQLILGIERDPSDIELLRSIRRAVHTLKGDSTAFGFSELTELAHHYEDALDRLRANNRAASRAFIDLLLAGSDAFTALINYYRGQCPMPDTAKLIASLGALRDSADETLLETVAGALPASPSPAVMAALPPVAETLPEANRGPAEQPAAETAPGEQVAIAAENWTGEERRQGADRRRGDRRQSQSMTLRVESERIDAAMNLVGELIIQRSIVTTLAAEIEAQRRGDDLARRLSEAVALSGRTVSELQESIMRMRLVAIDQVFRRFPRVVRDASIKLGKPLRIEIEGGHTEIDKSIVEIISDPLIHLVRNACDHGIEPPAARAAAGKPAEGLIKLIARRAGNQIAVEVVDDGGGIDPARVVAKAIEKGLITRQDVADWTDQQQIGLIFLPGFSTAEKISDMSGRGVGMDVVKTTVDSLGGSIAVSSVIGQGSRFTIKLPLTMAIVRAMMFETAARRFALPLDAIREITRLRPEEIKTIDGNEVLYFRDRVLPLVRVDEALGLRTTAERNRAARLFVFILDLGDGRDVGLAVERLYGEQELVLKTIDDSLCRTNLVAGASILGDGSVVLILDVNAIIQQKEVAKSDARR